MEFWKSATYCTKPISSYITKIQFQRLSADLADLGDGVSEAEYAFFPMRIKLMRIFIDVVHNPFIKPLLDRAKQLTLQRDLYIYQIKDGKKVKSKYLSSAIQNQHWFQDYLEYVLDAVYWGYTLIELGDIDTSQDNPFPNLTFTRRENLRPDGVDVSQEQSGSYNGIGLGYPNVTKPNKLSGNGLTQYSGFASPSTYNGKSGAVLTSIPYMIDGIRVQYSDDPLIPMLNHWIGTRSDRGVSTCGYGLLTVISELAINIRHIIEWWMDNIEMFGQPIRKATTKKQGDKRRTFENFVKNMGADPWVLLDPATEDDIEFVYPSGGAGTQWKSYQLALREQAAAASQLILGHADAIISMPGKLGGAQAANKDGFNESLIEQAMNSKQIEYGNFTCRKVNEISAPLFRKLGTYVGSRQIRDLIPEGYYLGMLNDKEEQEIIRRTNANMQNTSIFIKNMYDGGIQLSDPKPLNDWSESAGFPATWVKAEPAKELDEKEIVRRKLRRMNQVIAMFYNCMLC